MYIFLGIIGELATIIGCTAITINAGINSVLEISKNGYRIDKSVLDEVLQKEQMKEKKRKANLTNRVLGTILLLLPGVNLINASIKGEKLKRSVMNDPKVKESIVPMTEKEKEQYVKMENKLQKLTFTAFMAEKENEEEFLGFIGGKPIIVDHGLTSLDYKELIPLDYTLDEVKRLNEATTYSYRIGQVDRENIAIIGIPNPDSPINRIQFKEENYKIIHTYKKMTEEEAKDKKFIVYPFTMNEDTQENVNKVIQDIKQSRIYSKKKSALVTLLCGMEDSFFEEPSKEQGPVKKLVPNNKNRRD